MANAIITPSIIAKEALMQLRNNTVMANCVHRGYKKEFVKVGDTVSIRKPVKFVSTSGATRVNQDVEEAKDTVVIDKREHVSWAFSTQDLTLTIEEYSERYITPACIALANKVDRDLTDLYKHVWNWVGTPGQVVNSFSDFALAPERLDEMAVPQDSRKAVLTPRDNWGLLGGQTTLFTPGLVGGAYTDAQLGKIGNVSTMMDQNIHKHVVGVATGTPLVNGASQGTSYALAGATNTQSLITDGWTNSITGILKEGDVFTIAGVNAVNPVSREDAGFLQQFVVRADADSGASTGPATLTISPAIITSGPYQTVTAEPANNAAITVQGTGATSYSQSMAFHKNAFGLVMCPLELPDGAAFKARETHESTSIRVVKDYDIDTDDDVIRLDILYGVKDLYPDLATRMSGTA